MASILDTSVGLGVESTYGTPATITDFYEATSDDWQRQLETLEAQGFSGGQHALRSDRIKTITVGATGSINFAVPPAGAGRLLSHLLGQHAGPALVLDATLAHDLTASTSVEGPSGESFTVQVERADADGQLVTFTYPGCVPVSWELAAAVGGFVTARASYQAATERTDVARTAPTYEVGNAPYDWSEVAVFWGGTQLEVVDSFTLTGELGFKTDRRFLRRSLQPKRAVRTSVPTFSGTLEAEYTAASGLYDDFRDQEVRELRLSVRSSEPIDNDGTDDLYAELEVSLPSVQFTGSTPQASLTDLTRISLPFRALWTPGGDPAVSLRYRSTDATL